MVEVARYYLEDIDVDGFRFDAAKYIYYGETARNVNFWVKYMTDLREIKPEIYTVAEVWDSDSTTVSYSPALNCFDFTMSQADGMISSTVKHGNVNDFTSYVEAYLRLLNKQITSYSESLAESDADYAAGVIYSTPMLISFISNHDMDRCAGYMTYASGYAKMAANLLLLNTGSSFIYYGEEIAMKGSRGSASTDANRRLAMLWGDGDTVKNPTGSTFDSEKQVNGTVADMLGNGDSLLNHYKRVIMIRKANPEIASGEYHALKLDTKLGGFVSVLEAEDGTTTAAAVFHNTTGSPISVDLAEACFTDGTPMSSLFDVNSCSISGVALASMELEKTDASLVGTVLTVPEQSSVVIR